MSEKATARALMEAIPEQDPQRIESRGTAPGVPDIWCGDCAIETKCLRQWPKGDSTVVRLDHELTMHQYRWLNRRWNKGFKAFVVLQVRRVEWLLFAAPDAFILTKGNEVTRFQMKRHCLWYSSEGITYGAGAAELTINNWLEQHLRNIEFHRQETGIVARWKDI